MMGLELQLILNPVGCVFLCLRVYCALGQNCGSCIADECDPKTSICLLGCLPGFMGRGCFQACGRGSICRNPCFCERPCECDVQMKHCNKSLCRPIDFKKDVEEKELTWVLTVAGVLAVTACIVLVGVLCCARRRWKRGTRAGRLRGELLSLPCFDLCPQVRDEMLRKGGHLGLPGFQLGARDSLDTIGGDDEYTAKAQSNAFRHWRRQRAQVVGVKQERHMVLSSSSGYRWKRKWKDRKEASKQKRKLKHEQRKLRRQGVEKRGSIILPPTTSVRRKASPRMGRRGSNVANLLHRRGSSGGALLSVPKRRHDKEPAASINLPVQHSGSSTSSENRRSSLPATGAPPVQSQSSSQVDAPPRDSVLADSKASPSPADSSQASPPESSTSPAASRNRMPPPSSYEPPSSPTSPEASTPSSSSQSLPASVNGKGGGGVPLDVCTSHKRPFSERMSHDNRSTPFPQTSSSSQSTESQRHGNVDSIFTQSESNLGDLVFNSVMDVLDQSKKVEEKVEKAE